MSTRPTTSTRVAAELRSRWGGELDGVLHAIAFAPPDALGGGFLDTPASSAITAFETSAFSLKALAAALAPLLEAGERRRLDRRARLRRQRGMAGV